MTPRRATRWGGTVRAALHPAVSRSGCTTAARHAATGGVARGIFRVAGARRSPARSAGFLAAPEALAFQEMIPADPLLLLPGAVRALLKGGFALVQPPVRARPPTLVWARLAASPLSEAGQAPAFAAIDRVAAASVRADHPGFAVAYTGVNRFAAASRARIEREVTWLNALSLAAVLAVAFTFIRRVHRGLHLIPVVLLSMLGAWVAATLVFDRLHIMVFVVGSLLTGVAIDYGFYLFMQPPAHPGRGLLGQGPPAGEAAARELPHDRGRVSRCCCSPSCPSSASSASLSAPAWSARWSAAVVYFSDGPESLSRGARVPRRRGAAGRGAARLPPAAHRAPGSLALPGLALLQWKDDIRELRNSLAGAHARGRADQRALRRAGRNGRFISPMATA